MADITEMLGVSISTVRLALYEAGVSVGPGGLHQKTAGLLDRHLLEDLYADADVRTVLVRHDVALQDPAGRRRPGPFATFAPLPLSGRLMRELYEDMGLSTHSTLARCAALPAPRCSCGSGTPAFPSVQLADPAPS